MFDKLKAWLVGELVKWLLNQITSGGIEALAHKLQAKYIPLIRAEKNDIMQKLIAEAKTTKGSLWGEIDDAVYATVDEFLEALIPENPVQTLASLSKLSGEDGAVA